ncbi:MAG: hypothetical protein KDE53_14690 [Caldilineaceae bacterium]|nr:hypothetical protein [Caldilineaceae bacterium]MCB0121627.1 hypothetical protein [Caldilineaceae bacterium]
MSPIEWASFSINVAAMVTTLAYAVFSNPAITNSSSPHHSLTTYIGRLMRLIGLFSLSTVALYVLLLIGISALIGL